MSIYLRIQTRFQDDGYSLMEVELANEREVLSYHTLCGEAAEKFVKEGNLGDVLVTHKSEPPYKIDGPLFIKIGKIWGAS